MKHVRIVCLALVAVALQGTSCPGPPAPASQPPAGPFTFTAAPVLVTMPNNTLSQDVVFTITPVGTFAGTVRITWETATTCSPSPATNDFDVAVALNTPITFTRKMYRWDSSAPMTISWKARHEASATERTVQVGLRSP